MAYSEKTKNKAKRLWISGERIPTIAKKLSVPPKTIEGWKRRYNWAEKANVVYEKVEKSFWEKISDSLLAATQKYIDMADDIATISAFKIKIYASRKNINDEEIKTLRDVAKLALDGTNIIRNVQPEAKNEVAEKAIELEVQRLEKGA